MAVDVRPRVFIGGTQVACTADALEKRPVAIRGFTIRWGRSEYQSPDTSPASVTISLLDATDEWAERIRDSRAIGTAVIIDWIGTLSTTLSDTARTVMFRGRISEGIARPHHVETGDGRRAWLIELKCVDATADYGNANPAPETWPRETMLRRAIKIKELGESAGSPIQSVFFWPGYSESQCAPLDVKGKNALALMREMYESMGNDSYSYDPDGNAVRQAIRLSQPMSVYLATFDNSRGAVLPVANDITVDNYTYPGVGLGGRDLIGEPEIRADPTTDINRLECTWEDHSTNWGPWTTVKENIAPGQPRRVMAWNSWFDDGKVIDPTLENVWSRAREEGRRPRHPEFTLKPGFTFVSRRMARWCLMAWENTRPAFISGNLAYQWLMSGVPDYPPIVAPIGGETTFDPRRGWAIRLNVHWIHSTTPIRSACTWASLKQVKTALSDVSVPWWWRLLGLPSPPPVSIGQPTPERDMKWGAPPDINGYHWDASVTWSDLRHVPNAPSSTQIKDVLD